MEKGPAGVLLRPFQDKISPPGRPHEGDRKSTRLNSSHGYISYAVFCLKKKKLNTEAHNTRSLQPTIPCCADRRFDRPPGWAASTRVGRKRQYTELHPNELI